MTRVFSALILALFCCSTPTVAQKFRAHPASVKLAVNIPVTTGNRAFRGLINGNADVTLDYQFPFAGSLFLGAGFKYASMRVDEIKVPQLDDGAWNQYGIFGKVGAEKFISDRVFWSMGIRGGYSQINAQSQTCIDAGEGLGNLTQQAAFFQPEVGIYLISEDNLAFGIQTSYQISTAEFDPYQLCLDRFGTVIDEGHEEGNYQWWNLGFSMSYFIGRNAIKR